MSPSPLRVAHVAAGLGISHGGPATSIPRLCQATDALGTTVGIHYILQWTGGAGAGIGRIAHLTVGHEQVGAAIPGISGLCVSPALKKALRHEAGKANVLHAHGLWQMPSIYAAQAAARARKPFILSPRGMLGDEALKFSRVKKRAFWQVLQGPAARSAACIHATSDREFEEIRANGLRNPVAVIRNGIDLPDCPTAAFSPLGPARSVLSLGRLHPIKGLDRLLQAWARIEPQHPDWRLRIIGAAADAYERQLRTLAADLGLVRVSIEPAVYGEDKLAAYRSADLFVLPSLNENFAMTVAEALAAGVPVVATKGAPWSGLETTGCGWWIDQGVEPLAAALSRGMAMDAHDLRAMGEKGRAWMERDFSWERVARDMVDVYLWLAHGGNPPATVRFN